MTEEIIVEDAPVVEVPYIAPPELGDLYLKFTDEAQSIEVLAGYEGSIDVIGIIYRVDNTDPLADSVGQENPIYTPYDGWHVNTRGPMTLELEAFSVVPTNPRRVWA